MLPRASRRACLLFDEYGTNLIHELSFFLNSGVQISSSSTLRCVARTRATFLVPRYLLIGILTLLFHSHPRSIS